MSADRLAKLHAPAVLAQLGRFSHLGITGNAARLVPKWEPAFSDSLVGDMLQIISMARQEPQNASSPPPTKAARTGKPAADQNKQRGRKR